MGLSRQLVVGITGIAFLGGVRADPSYCYSIQNQDRKNYCLVTAKKQQSYCYSIGDQDYKNFCLAHAGNQKSYCYSIRSQDAKNHCLGTVR
jgi:hypothetical protein